MRKKYFRWHSTSRCSYITLSWRVFILAASEVQSLLEDSGMLTSESVKLHCVLNVCSRKYEQDYRVVNVKVINRILSTLERQNSL